MRSHPGEPVRLTASPPYEQPLTKWTVSRVAFDYYSKASIQSCSVKLLFSYPPHVFFWGYDQWVYLATTNHLINRCDYKIRLMKNQIIKHQIRKKIKTTRLVKFLSCFLKWLECVEQTTTVAAKDLVSFQNL